MAMEEKLPQTSQLARKEIDTPLGSMSVVLATPDQVSGEHNPGFVHNMQLLERIVSVGPVAAYIQNFGKDQNPITPRPNHDDSIPDARLLPKIVPTELEILDCVAPGGKPFMAYGRLRYQQEQAGQMKPVERVIFFRPDSGTSLVVLKDKDSGKRYVVLNRGMKDGVGAPFTGEVSAGSMDKPYKDLAELALKEISEEIGLSEDELRGAEVSEAFPALTASPGGTPERIAGYQVELSVPSDRLTKLKEHIGATDEHEVIQQILVELPQLSTHFTQQDFEAFSSEWDSVMAMTKDLKTFSLLQNLRNHQADQLIRNMLESGTQK